MIGQKIALPMHVHLEVVHPSADDDPGPRRPGPATKLSWTTVLRKVSSAANDMGAGDTGDSPKVAATHPISRPSSNGPTSFRQVTRTGSNVGILGLSGTNSLGPKEGASASGALGGRSHSVLHAGLLAPGQGNGTTADVVTAVKDLQLRKRSIMFQQTASQTGPSLQTRTGCLSTYFFAPNPTPGKLWALAYTSNAKRVDKEDIAFLVQVDGFRIPCIRTSVTLFCALTMADTATISDIACTFHALEQGVCFSPDGAYVMRWGYGTDVKLLSADDGVLVVTITGPTPGAVRYATFNSDGSKVAVATEDCKVCVWLTANKHLVNMLDVGAEPLAHIVFSRDGRHLLSCDDEGQLELWDVTEARMLRRYDTGHISKKCGFSANGDSVMSCAGDDCGLVMLSTRTGGVQTTQLYEEVAECRNRACYVISPDGTKVLLFIQEQVYGINLVVYHTETDVHIPMVVCNGAVTHADFSNDSSLFITAGRDDLIHVWESETGMLRTTLQGHASDVMFCKISDDGEVAVSGDSEGTVLVWTLSDSACVMRLQAHSSPIAYVDVNADGTRALTVDTEGHALLWFLDAARAFEVLRQHSDLVCCVAPSPDGSSLVVGYKDGCLRCWNVCDGPGLVASVTWTHSKQDSPVEQLVMRPDGAQVASAGRDGMVVVTDMRRGLVVAALNAHTDFVTGLLFSERSDLLVTASRVGEVFVWNAKAYGLVPLRQLEVPELTEVASLAISPNQAFLAAATAGGSVHVWSLNSFVLQSDVKVTDLPATRLTFNADASVLAVGSADGSVTLIDPLTGTRAAYYKGNASSINDVAFLLKPEHILLSVCGRQAIKWDCHRSTIHHVTDFIADNSRIFSSESIGSLPNRACVAHDAVVLYDPINHAAMYDMVPRPPEQHPGNSYLFRHGTALTSGTNGHPMVLFCAPDTTVHMLSDETSGTRCLDFSSDGRLLVSGTLRGELVVWDVVHQQQMHKWVAHKRYAITCVRFTHDATAVYSCAEDCKVIMWDWRRQTKLAVLVGHQAPVQAVEMSVDGNQMASGDKDGFIFIWDTVTHSPKQVIPAHDGSVLCCSLSPCGTMVASTGADEHIVILDVHEGRQLASLDDAMDGKGLTIKFSFDGTRLLVGGEKGGVLIWDVARNCLLYDIPAHDGKVFDCGWSGDSRRLLSVGSDGRARLWDAAAGSELCQANFERVMGAVESGGFVHCDLSATGSRMAGCTAKGQLIDWDVGAELRCVPEGSMLYQRLSALSVGRSREVYARLLRQFPLLPNTQDSRGWTILMHAVANSNPEITKLIIGSVPSGSGKLGLTASAVQNSILSSIRHVPRVQMQIGGTSGKQSTPGGGSGLAWEGNGSKRSNLLGGDSSNAVMKLGSPGVSGKKLTVLEPLDKGRIVDDEDENLDDDDDQDSGLSSSAPRTVATSPTAAAAAAAAVQRRPSSGAGTGGGGLLSRMGSFLRSGAELLSPTRERAGTPSEESRAAAGMADQGGGNASPLGSGHLGAAELQDRPIRRTAASSPTPGTGSLPSILKNNPSKGPGTGSGTAGAVSEAGGGLTSNISVDVPVMTDSAPQEQPSLIGRRSFGGSGPGGMDGSVRGGITYATGRRSLLGSVLEAERERDSAGARSRRRSFMFGNGVPHGGGGSSSQLTTTNLGRSIRHMVHKLARVSSRGGGRDLEEATPPEDNVDVRHVSDLSRNGWHEEDHDQTRSQSGAGSTGGKGGIGREGNSAGSGVPSASGNRGSNRVWPESQSPDRTEPNVIKIALDAGAADCVQHVLDAVLAQKVTPGSYHAITAAIPAVAQQYPTMCQVFLSGLPLRPLGEMEVPSSIAARGMIVTSAPSYTSYKEMWTHELQLGGGNKGPMALMEACMVPLPFAAASGKTSVLHTLVESSVPVQTYGSDTVKAIVDYKWRNFAQRRIYIKALVYLLYTVIFTVFAVLFADHDTSASLKGLFSAKRGVAMVAFAAILFLYGNYFLVLECVQLASLGAAAYFDSFWNIVDIAAYVTTLVVCPCTVFRKGIGKGDFVAVLVAAEVIMLWVKVLFFGLAIDGVGTFIFMTAEIIKGLKYFIGLLATLFISFAVAFMVLFRDAPTSDGGEDGLGSLYGDFGNSLLNVYLVMFTIGDPHKAAETEYGHFAILLFCVYMFALLVVMLNMIITLMADIYQKVKGIQHFVFLKGRAELIIDVESTTGGSLMNADHPYLHLLMPLRKDAGAGDYNDDDADKLVTASVPRGASGNAGMGPLGAVVSRAVSLTGGIGRGIGGGGAVDGASGSNSDDDDGRSVVGRALSRMPSFKSMRSFAATTTAAAVTGGGHGQRRIAEPLTGIGSTTMRRVGNAAAAAIAAAEAERLERLERAVNRLTANLDTVMNHMRIRRQSNSGGPGLLATETLSTGATASNRRGVNQRSTMNGVGNSSMPARGVGRADNSFGGPLPGGVPSRGPSRPTSALGPSPSLPPPVVVAHLGMPGAVPSVPVAIPTFPSGHMASTGGSSGAGAGAGSHGHLHATFADQYGSFLTTDADGSVRGVRAPEGQERASSSSRNNTSTGAGGAGTPVAAGSPVLGSVRSGTPDKAVVTIAGGAGGGAPPGGGGGGSGGGGVNHTKPSAVPQPGETSDVQTGVASPVVRKTTAARLSEGSPSPSSPSGGTAAPVSSQPNKAGSVRGVAAVDRSARSSNSASSSNGAGGGVATAARLVLDPEEPAAWGGSGPGRPPADSANVSAEPRRIRTPGEVDPSG
ncbi:hypothetical protein VOLCADRAFT_88109 [Volvox carteri f. nagariensis]|uniref:Ion transport domain-containing protein n=1 Tax=Volvox carteri f. nagariensis TaxID=3068 RepID=D8TN37_VOLCA|nr:uncharacterized protein VOLCADRAFT_88109 [Volvox carteri f. nagariensis]EFJ51236.1 hypothetical protein VOLCADRAFT_88109 [Volvox carteri f. nagariensis]|eukprot:XP_002947703.1 hypothetical protein VOLCADRAFT_88109 [Volvox carteri f. nagariensis]